MTYGTPEYYMNLFADTLADVQADEPEVGDAIIEGFILALQDWKDYHAKQVDEFNRIEQRVRQASSV